MQLKMCFIIFLLTAATSCANTSTATAPHHAIVIITPTTPDLEAYRTVSGLFVPDEITDNMLNAQTGIAATVLAEDARVVYTAEDILPSRIQAQQNNHMIFSCNITYYSGNRRGYGNAFLLRLCHMPPDDDPRLVRPFAYSVDNGWSPDGAWFVFVGAEDGMALALCEQRFYTYNVLTGEVVSLMPESDARICSVRQNIQWEVDNGDLWILFEAWTGGEQSDSDSYSPYRILFSPNQ